MVEQLRLKDHIRQIFGKYIDPRVVEGLIDKPILAADGQHRVMTVMFCDIKGFTGASKGMTPQGLVKVMNRFFSAMSVGSLEIFGKTGIPPGAEKSGAVD